VSLTDELLDHDAALGAGLGHGALLLGAREAGRRARLHGYPLSVDGILGLGEETPTWSGTPAG
jgi:hypothetical protein